MTDQRPPVNEPASALWIAYAGLVQQAALHLDAAADGLGLDATALRGALLAWSSRDMSPGRLAELTGLTTGAVTGVLDRLERAGFVERVPDPTDRRKTLVRVSPDRGREIVATYDALERATEDALGSLEADQRSLVTSVLVRLRDAVAADTERLRAASRGGMVGEMFSAPLGGADRGRLQFRSGAPRLALRAAPLGPANEVRAVAELTRTTLRIDGASVDGELCRASFEGPHPDIATRAGEVTMAYKRRLDWREREARVSLGRAVPWSVEVSGGLSAFEADLRRVRVHELRVQGSVDQVTVRLGEPDGTSRLRLSGSARDILIEHPSGTPVRVSVSGGVHDFRVGHEHLRDVHGKVRLLTPGAEGTADRFEVEVSGGARTIRVTTG